MLLINIKRLLGVHRENKLLKGKAMAQLPSIEDAYLRIIDDKIAAFGPMSALENFGDEEIINVRDRLVLPAWCDSHTHLVFSGSREQEFVQKLKGLSYAEIAAKDGGIQNSAKNVQAATEEELYHTAMSRLHEIMATGTGAVEIKSGYGLSVRDELKMLRVIKRLKKNSPMTIKRTFLGAHAIPSRLKGRKEAYLREVIDEMLPVIEKENLADYIDVFCEKGFFELRDTQKILQAGKEIGLKGKLHANQLNNFGAVQLGIAEGAVSVDHLEKIGIAEIEKLKNSETIPTLLPGAAFFLRMGFPPARQMIDAGLGLAIASDYNPGSSPSGNIPYLLALSCIQMRLLPEEAINALTLNGACAMEVQEELGSIALHKKANLIITKAVPSVAYLPYAFGSNWIDQVIIGGKIQHQTAPQYAELEDLR